MRKRSISTALAVGVAVAASVLVWVGSGVEAETGPVMPAEVNLTEGEALYGSYCAACHGADLEGQPDWQSAGPDGRMGAPPHDETGHTWHHSDSVLFQYTKLGGREALALRGVDFDSGMPGFSEDLSDGEIWNILAYIQSTWPDRVRKVQAARTAASRPN